MVCWGFGIFEVFSWMVSMGLLKQVGFGPCLANLSIFF